MVAAVVTGDHVYPGDQTRTCVSATTTSPSVFVNRLAASDDVDDEVLVYLFFCFLFLYFDRSV